MLRRRRAQESVIAHEILPEYGSILFFEPYHSPASIQQRQVPDHGQAIWTGRQSTMKVPLQQVEQVVHQHQCKTSSDAIDDVFPRNIEHRWLSLGPARNGIKEKDNCLV